MKYLVQINHGAGWNDYAASDAPDHTQETALWTAQQYQRADKDAQVRVVVVIPHR